jgi:hypothetical protein
MTMKKKQNNIPEYVIEELIPRFRGVDTPTIANVKCDFLNMNGNFIMSKTSKSDHDVLHFDLDGDVMFKSYDIRLYSDKMYCETKESYERCKIDEYDEVDGMLTTYHHSITTGTTYVTSIGFENHFKIRALRKDFGIDIKKNYKFDSSKLKVNDVFEITFDYKLKQRDVRYGILLSVKDTTLKLKLSIGFDPDDDYGPMNYRLNIDDIVSGKIKLERVNL